MGGYSTRGRWVRSRSKSRSCMSPGGWHWERPRPPNQGQGHSQSPMIKLNTDVPTVKWFYSEQLDMWMTTDDSMNWKKEVFCVNLNAEDRILNFQIFEGSMFFYEVSWFDDRNPCYLPCFTVGTTMMSLCLRQTVPIHSTTADRSLYRWVFLLTSQRDRWEGDFRKIEMCQSF